VLRCETEAFNAPCASIIQLSYTSKDANCEPVQVPFTSSSCYFVLPCAQVRKGNTF